MPETSRAEFYFIWAMMFLILVLCVVSVWAFFRAYRKEMKQKEARKVAVAKRVEASNSGVNNGSSETA